MYWNDKAPNGGYSMKYSPEQRKAYGEKKRQKMREHWHNTYISKTGLIERGWNKKEIAYFLEGKEVNAGPIKAYFLSRIIRLENSKRFKEYREKQNDRLETAERKSR